jgi:endonuclease YncB( thermonuclease family)
MTTWTVPARVSRVIDGDTLVCDLDLGWGLWLHDRRVRLAGVNCPEMNTLEGEAARLYVTELLAEVKWQVTVVSHSLDKYGRVLGEVRLGENEATNLSAFLLADGHAVPMKG